MKVERHKYVLWLSSPRVGKEGPLLSVGETSSCDVSSADSWHCCVRRLGPCCSPAVRCAEDHRRLQDTAGGSHHSLRSQRLEARNIHGLRSSHRSTDMKRRWKGTADNSRNAYFRAGEAGLECIETDIRLFKDEFLPLIHDSGLGRETDVGEYTNRSAYNPFTGA